LRLALLIAATIGFPFFVYGVIQATDAQKVSGAAGALAVVLGIYLKPLIFFIFAASLAGISVRRAMASGLPWMAGALIVVLVVCDWQFGVAFGAHWGVAFSLGILSASATSLLVALIASVTLIFLRDKPQTMPEHWPLARRLWMSLLTALVILGLSGLAPLLLWLPGMGTLLILLLKVKLWLSMTYLYPTTLVVAFCAATVFLIAVSRSGPDGGIGFTAPKPPQPRSPASAGDRHNCTPNTRFGRRA
jgi:hypothetical protein